MPEGWTWTRLASVLSLSSGKSLKVRQLTSEEEFPVYGGNGINGTHSDYNVDSDTIIIGRVGFYCGNVYKTSSKAWVTDNALIAAIKEKSIFDIDFLVAVLKYLDLGKTSVSTAQPVVSGKGILTCFDKFFFLCSYTFQKNGSRFIIRVLWDKLSSDGKVKDF